MTTKKRRTSSSFPLEDSVLAKGSEINLSFSLQSSHICIYIALTSVYMFSQIIATEVLLHDIDISSAIVDYITNNSIANIVLGASARNSFLKSLSFSHITYNCNHNLEFHEH